MKYTGTFVDGATQQMVERDLTDDEVLETFAPQLVFSASAAQAPADGVTVVTVNVQLASLPLSDDTRRFIREAREISILVDGEPETIQLDSNGHAALPYAFASPGDYEFAPAQGLAGTSITIQAV